MLALYDDHPVLGPRLRMIAPQVEAWLGWPPAILDQLIRAAIVAHDAGKLSPAWQQGIAAYQRAINQPMRLWLVHTDSPPHGLPEPHWRQPHHALSGAAHSLEVGSALDANVIAAGLPAFAGARPSNVLFTAIATHHSPTVSALHLSTAELLDEPALTTLNQLIGRWSLPGRASSPANPNLAAARKMVDQLTLTTLRNGGETFALALVIRMLRLADGWSQEPARLKEAHI
jgi:hypothetical protein